MNRKRTFRCLIHELVKVDSLLERSQQEERERSPQSIEILDLKVRAQVYKDWPSDYEFIVSDQYGDSVKFGSRRAARQFFADYFVEIAQAHEPVGAGFLQEVYKNLFYCSNCGQSGTHDC